MEYYFGANVGFVAKGAHLPTLPPLPEALVHNITEHITNSKYSTTAEGLPICTNSNQTFSSSYFLCLGNIKKHKFRSN